MRTEELTTLNCFDETLELGCFGDTECQHCEHYKRCQKDYDNLQKKPFKAIIGCGCIYFDVTFDCYKSFKSFQESRFKCEHCLRLLKAEKDDD